MTDIDKLSNKLRNVSDMIVMGEAISFGQETALMDQAADTLPTLQAENARLRVALENIASQKITEEMDDDEINDGCFLEGFDICVTTARSALQGGDDAPANAPTGRKE